MSDYEDAFDAITQNSVADFKFDGPFRGKVKEDRVRLLQIRLLAKILRLASPGRTTFRIRRAHRRI